MAYVAPYCLVIVPITLVMYFYIAKDFMATNKEINTLESKNGYASITSHLNESIDGKHN